MAWYLGTNVVGKLCKDGKEGMSFMAFRWIGHDHPNELPDPKLTKVEKGPFFVHRDAIVYAHQWRDAENPPPIPPHEPLEIQVAEKDYCQVTAVAVPVSDSAPDGYQSSVSRTIPGKVPEGSPDGTVVEPTTITQGPFGSVREAVDYAHLWTDPEHPPAMPKPVADVSQNDGEPDSSGSDGKSEPAQSSKQERSEPANPDSDAATEPPAGNKKTE